MAPVDKFVVRDQALNMLTAGRDTTASTIVSAVYLLAMHPSVLRNLRAEVISRVGTTRAPSPEDVRDMKYLRAVINETLRLFPPAPFNVR
jgi:cytochrome P450